MSEDWRRGGFGLYVHWPFCQAKCPYCDFNSHVSAGVDQDRWAKAYEAEIARYGQELSGRKLDSIFFGGGTPSLMAPETVDRVIAAARAAWPLANDVEITLEANPTSAEAKRFEGYKSAGVDRISMGIQSLNDSDLRTLGRLHSAAEAREAFAEASEQFSRVSFDLIYARQDQSLQDWETELSQALDMARGHLSLYQLTIEDGTAFGRRHAAGGLSGLPDEDLAADLYELTQEMTMSAGLAAYEVSNHAAPGAESRHNLIYWRGGDYVGIGPGAHGRLTLGGRRYATETPLGPAAWLNLVERDSRGETGRDALSERERLAEALMMGLRVREGVELARLAGLGGGALMPRIETLVELGLLSATMDSLRLTERGRPLLNAVLRKILT